MPETTIRYTSPNTMPDGLTMRQKIHRSPNQPLTFEVLHGDFDIPGDAFNDIDWSRIIRMENGLAKYGYKLERIPLCGRWKLSVMRGQWRSKNWKDNCPSIFSHLAELEKVSWVRVMCALDEYDKHKGN